MKFYQKGPDSQELIRLRMFFYVLLFLSLFGLFIVFSYYIPVDRFVGWVAVILFLLLFSLGEPLYRRLTNRWQHHILVLEFYVLTVATIQLMYPEGIFIHWLYALPIFSSALSFGLPGTSITAGGILLVEMVRTGSIHLIEISVDLTAFESLLPDLIPLVMLALILGFTVELKDVLQRQVVQVLSRRDVIHDLLSLVRQTRWEEQGLDRILDTLLDASEVRGVILWDEGDGSILERINVSKPEALQIIERTQQKKSLPPDMYQTTFPILHSEARVVFTGLPEQGILNDARRELIRSLLDYLEQSVAAEQAVRERNLVLQKTELLYDMVPVGILECGEDGLIENINSHARSLLDSAPKEDLRFQELFYDGNEHVPLVEQRREARMNRPNGIPVDLAVVSIPSERQQEWLAVFTDQRPFIQSREEAERERRLRLVGEIGASLAHEIRNPLGSLAGYLSILEQRIGRRERDGKLAEPVVKLRKAYQALDALVQQFVDFAQQPTIQNETFQLQDVIQEAINLVNPPEEIEVRVEAPAEGITVKGIPERFRVALINIMRNSIDAINGPGTIRFRLKRRDEFVEVLVTDSGEGMDQDVLNEVFEPFFTTRDEGLGLGMSIVHRIVRDEFGGDVVVESEPGEGTTIRIKI